MSDIASESENAGRIADLTTIEGIRERYSAVSLSDIADLGNFLRSNDLQVRIDAAWSLSEIAIVADIADGFLPIFFKYIHDPEPLIRILMCNAIRNIRQSSEKILKALIVALADDDIQVSHSAMLAIETSMSKYPLKSDCNSPTLFTDLTSSNHFLRAYATLVLLRSGQANCQEINSAIKDDSIEVRRAAAVAFAVKPVISNIQISQVERILSDTDVICKILGCKIANIMTGSLIFRLQSLLVDNYDTVRSQAVRSIGSVNHFTGIDNLVEIADSDNSSLVLLSILDVIYTSRCSSPQIFKRLIDLSLSNEDESVQFLVEHTLLLNFDIFGGTDYTETVRKLLTGLYSKYSEVRARTLRLLSHFWIASFTVPDIILDWASSPGDMRFYSLCIIEREHNYEKRVAILESAAMDPDSNIRSLAARMIGSIETLSKPLEQQLVSFLLDVDPTVCFYAAKSLIAHGIESNLAKDTLRHLLASPGLSAEFRPKILSLISDEPM